MLQKLSQFLMNDFLGLNSEVVQLNWPGAQIIEGLSDYYLGHTDGC